MTSPSSSSQQPQRSCSASTTAPTPALANALTPAAASPAVLTCSSPLQPMAMPVTTATVTAEPMALSVATAQPMATPATTTTATTTADPPLPTGPVLVRSYSHQPHPPRPPPPRHPLSFMRSLFRARTSPTPSAPPARKPTTLPPIDAFSFTAVLAAPAPSVHGDISADLDRIAEICARSRYSLSNQYEVHQPFARRLCASSAEPCEYHRAVSLPHRSSAAIASLETIMSVRSRAAAADSSRDIAVLDAGEGPAGVLHCDQRDVGLRAAPRRDGAALAVACVHAADAYVLTGAPAHPHVSPSVMQVRPGHYEAGVVLADEDEEAEEEADDTLECGQQPLLVGRSGAGLFGWWRGGQSDGGDADERVPRSLAEGSLRGVLEQESQREQQRAKRQGYVVSAAE